MLKQVTVPRRLRRCMDYLWVMHVLTNVVGLTILYLGTPSLHCQPTMREARVGSLALVGAQTHVGDKTSLFYDDGLKPLRSLTTWYSRRELLAYSTGNSRPLARAAVRSYRI